MKKRTLLSLFSVLFMACESQKVLTEIPNSISSYIDTHFPDKKILQTVKERDGLRKSYEVIIEGNISLEFNKSYEITAIESKTALPHSVIPAKILSYVQAQYPTNTILEWELDDRRQKIELDNKMELEFSKAGDFLRID